MALASFGIARGAYADTPAMAPATTQAATPAPTPDNPAPDPTGATQTAPSALSTPGFTALLDPDKATLKDTATFANNVAQGQARNYYSINFVWTLFAGFLVMFMQAGFALVETGLCRGKNAAHVMSMNFLVYALGMTGFFISGFAFMCGGANKSFVGGPATLNLARTDQLAKGISISGGAVTDDTGAVVKNADGTTMTKDWMLCGTTGFFLNGGKYDSSVVVWFLFMMVFMDTTATIPTGALAERWKFSSFFIFSLFVGGVIYPIYGGWVWGGGWLAQLGKYSHLGHGAVDYAGSGVVHLQGGMLGLVCSWLLGARIGKYDANGKPRPILGHNIPMVILGTFILAFGWFGFNAGSSLAGADGRIGIVATNTMLASAAGALASCLYMWVIHSSKKPDPSMMCNGMLAGLVAITCPCAFVAPWAAFLIGGVSGVLVVWSVFFFEKIGIDDPVGAISVHGVNGAWGLISLGLLADGTYGDGYNSIAGGVTGLFYGGNGAKQLIAQCIDVCVCAGWNIVVGGVIFFAIGKVLGGNRPAPEFEIAGLDIPEMGAPAYPEYITTMAPENVPSSQISEAKAQIPQLASIE